MKKLALILGGNGIIGRNLQLYFEKESDWDVVVSSRSELKYNTSNKFVQLDLRNKKDIEKNKDILKNVTHVFYAAYIEKQNPYEQVKVNEILLENLIYGLESINSPLERVVFIQGGKAYGAHLGVYKTPAKESDARSITPNFYYTQEDFLRNESKGKKWSWTAIRPDIIIGFTVGNAMNLTNIIAIYASICKEEGLPLRFPGSAKAYEALVNVTGTDILSRGMKWAAQNEDAKEEIFNITNGDVFRWHQAFRQFAQFFKMNLEDPQPFSLQEYMSGKEDIWNEITKKYKLLDYKLSNLVQWPFGDFIFNVENDAFFDVNKARRYGFNYMNIDSVEYMIKTFNTLKINKIIP